MFVRECARCLVILSAFWLVVAASSPARADLGQAALALAGPLAEQFGVPASAVTGLLESGISLDSVTQLLLVSQGSGSSLDSVASLFSASGNDIAETAKKLDVAPSVYAPEKVSAALDAARRDAQTAASDKAAAEANDAVGSALDGVKW